MPPCFARAVLGLIAGLAISAGTAAAAAAEFNAWPFLVKRSAEGGRPSSWTAAGPFVFKQPAEEGVVSGFRPFWTQRHDPDGKFREGHFLYPIFSYTVDDTVYRWSVYELIRRIDRRPVAEPARSMFEQRAEFEVWPFWFSRQHGDPELSYRGFFPIAGTVKNKLGMDRFTWVAFPLYAQIEKRGAITTQTPWPFIRVTRGAAHGWGVWPLYTVVERPGISREVHYLWPLGYDSFRQPLPDDPPGTPARHDFGVLPFYARSTGPGYINVSYGWPFFGFTDRTLPTRYHETRYFWPLLVQGRGDDKFVSRWGPFYTHSIVKGYDKRWYGWPLVRHAEWAEEGVARTKTQVLYFLYSAQRQRSIARPELPAATLTHVWPLLSTWNNGAGRRQWQLFSPLEVFFPGNENVRQTWTPFFAIARHDQRAPGEARTSLLWDAITWERRDRAAEREFHLGPLFSIVEQGGEKRLAIGNGLFGFHREAGGRWRMFWLDFRRKPGTTSPSG